MEGHARLCTPTQLGPKNLESLSLSSAGHGHNSTPALLPQSEPATPLDTSLRTKGKG